MSKRPLVAVFLALGCRQPEVHFVPTVTIDAEQRGVAVSEDGGLGFVAMRDTTCSVSLEDAMVIGDVNLPGEQDTILDASGVLALARSDAGIHVISRSEDLELYPGAPTAAVLTDRGPVGLEPDCTLTWYAEGARYPVADCDPDQIAAPRGGEHAYVIEQGVVTSFGAAGARVAFGASSGPIAWDERFRLLLAADGERVTAYDAAGRSKWSFDLGVSPDQILELGPGIGLRAGSTWVVVGRDGSEIARTDDGPNGHGESSGDGTTITVTIGGRIEVFRIEVGSLEPGPSEPVPVFD
ncbi:MAG: hypothetical protein ABMA64_18660 [Myxococcota bacterium]